MATGGSAGAEEAVLKTIAFGFNELEELEEAGTTCVEEEEEDGKGCFAFNEGWL